MVGQLVDLQNDELKWVFGGPGWIQEKAELLLRHGGSAVEHFERLGDPAKYPDHGSHQLAGREVLAGMQDVGGLLGHGPGEGAQDPALLQGARGQLGVLEEGSQEGAHLVHGGDGGVNLYSKQVGLGPYQLLMGGDKITDTY